MSTGQPDYSYMQNRKKLIYIIGLGRSGSTLVGQILGANKDSRCVGEFLSFVSLDDLSRSEYKGALDVRDLPCGCGKPTRSCDVNAINRYLQKYDLHKVRKWFSNKSFLPIDDNNKELGEFFESVKAVYESYPETTIVDTSKNGRLLIGLRRTSVFDDYDIRGVFVFRNLSEVWQSWRRGDKSYLKKKSRLFLAKHIIGSLLWTIVAFCQKREQNFFLNLKDLRDDPKTVVNSLNTALDLNIELDEENQIIVAGAENHESGGNPSKLLISNRIRIQR